MAKEMYSPRSELTAGVQNIAIVAPDEVLSHVGDCSMQACLAVVICRLLADIPSELGDFDLFLQVLLEARKEYFTL